MLRENCKTPWGEEVHCRLKENLDADVQLGGWGPISSFDDGPPVLAKNLVFTVAKMQQRFPHRLLQ